jgi:sulfhydrogenase subunit beta (sulfur reductase)
MLRLTEREVFRLCGKLQDLGYEVVAPIKINGNLKLAVLERGNEPVLQYTRINNSPRDFLLPIKESLFRYKSTAIITSYGLKIRFPTSEGPCPITITPEYTLPKKKLAFFGIHPCLLNSIAYLDKVMLSEPADPYYSARREGMLTVALECEEGDDFCLCQSVGSYRIPDGYADIILRKAGAEYLARNATERGRAILNGLGKQDDGAEAKEIVPKMKTKYVFEGLDEASIDSRAPNPPLETCTLCAACTVTCPTCYCGDIEDKFSLMDPANVERVRVRMSCQRRCYSSIAGGVIFLKAKDARFRWRLKHKFPFSMKAYGMSGCIGCGNCIAQCPSRIDFRTYLGRAEA